MSLLTIAEEILQDAVDVAAELIQLASPGTPGQSVPIAFANPVQIGSEMLSISGTATVDASAPGILDDIRDGLTIMRLAHAFTANGSASGKLVFSLGIGSGKKAKFALDVSAAPVPPNAPPVVPTPPILVPSATTTAAVTTTP